MLHRFLLMLAAAACTGWAGQTSLTPDAALARLQAGNARFVAGSTVHPNQTVDRRTELNQGQHPFAIVLTCADSRLSPEIIFDQGLGDLFVVRNAGNLLDDHVIASIEYAVEHLGASLVVVLGHSKCGAVSAAVAGGHLPGHLPSIAASLSQVVAEAKKTQGDTVDRAVRLGAGHSADQLRDAEPILAEAAKAGKVKIVSGYYDLATGRVELLH